VVQAARELNPDLSARHRFGAELRRWRTARGLSQAGLARLIYVSPDLIGKIEKAERWPSQNVVERCEGVLGTGEALSSLWPLVNAQRRQPVEPAVEADVAPTDHWSRLLTVLATAGNAVGVGRMVDVVADELRIIDRRRLIAGERANAFSQIEARWLEFGSWVADNGGDRAKAAAWLLKAGALADRAGDPLLGGYIMMRRAQRAVDAGDAHAAVDLAGAIQLEQLPARIRALSLVRAAQALALTGDRNTVSSHLRAAHRVLDHGYTDEVDASLAGHCTHDYVRAHEAHCRLLLGDAVLAVEGYRDVLAGWSEDQRLDEGLFRAQMALAYDQAGMREEADAEGRRALTLGTRTGSRRTLATLDQLAERRGAAKERRREALFLTAPQPRLGEGAS
jgi:transcriptional regulator with XRE-family HTH domain